MPKTRRTSVETRPENPVSGAEDRPWLGSHLSIAGGMYHALDAVTPLQCDCVQVFTKNQRQWKSKPLSDEDIAAWKAGIERLGWGKTPARVVSHNSYLVNMASPDPESWEKSVSLQREELERCEALGIPACVAHPGAHLESKRKPGDPNPIGVPPSADEEKGLARIVNALDRLEKETRGFAVRTALENTVGSGTNLGYDPGQLGWIRDRVKAPERVGFCFDTCHAVAAGHDMSTKDRAEGVLGRIDETCGLDQVLAVHLNDSIGTLGSRKDRHAHIGHGTCSEACFKAVLRVPAWRGIPFVLETEKEGGLEGRSWDEINLDTLGSLAPGTSLCRP
ncbi:MAG: deoxyribonuclease IV [Phycisphaerales bacterium]